MDGESEVDNGGFAAGLENPAVAVSVVVYAPGRAEVVIHNVGMFDDAVHRIRKYVMNISGCTIDETVVETNPTGVVKVTAPDFTLVHGFVVPVER